MERRQDISVITQRRNGRWINIIAGSFATQEEAAAEGRQIAQDLKGEWFLRARSGRWRLRNTYGSDPQRTAD